MSWCHFCPLLVLHGGDAEGRDYEAARSKPEDQHGVMDVARLSAETFWKYSQEILSDLVTMARRAESIGWMMAITIANVLSRIWVSTVCS